ncbi:MAG: hypothetical protein CMJ84_08740 [Planctomycetes bacterium]|jgi:hypothetical protein|nr:hypothetical protein [Planctomycetota bacterium]MDP6410685.1 hypothetical protein [Planctomycetota bacterium]
MNAPTLSVLLASLALALAPSEARAGGGVSISYRGGGLSVQASLGRSVRSYGGYRASRPARRVWVPGHHELVQRRHWIPGPTRQVWVPAPRQVVYDACGRPRTVLVSGGHWETVTDPGHFEVRHVQVWRRGAWRFG